MMSALYVGTMGMKTHDSGLAVVANNLSNANTVAFKQQQWLFQDIMYENLNLGSSNQVVNNQRGMGSVQVASRTLFTQGGFESGGNFTELAIAGKGFFKVTSPNNQEYLTRSGNFFFDKTGKLTDPTGATLQAYPIANWQKSGVEVRQEGELQNLQLDLTNKSFISPPIATSTIQTSFNIGLNKSSINTHERVTIPDPTPTDPDNTKIVDRIKDPYFSMLSTYNAQNKPPLPNTGYSQPLTVYDPEGNRHNLNVTFDLATDANGQKTMEYVVTIPPAEDGRPGMSDGNGNYANKAGMLMAGTLTFSSSGQLISLSSFTPKAGSTGNQLSDWVPSGLQDGLPVIPLTFKGQSPQNISFNIGAKANSGWTNPNITAADINTNRNLLPTIGVPPELESTASTAYSGASQISQYIQDGASSGELTNMAIKEDGVVTGMFSNGKSHELYRIPIYRVTSEDGLRREGKNHYLVTDDCGIEENGIAGTENYGKVLSSQLETSNVDMSREMVNLIILQRGFQSNSKTITTADQMLQKAMELKRM